MKSTTPEFEREVPRGAVRVDLQSLFADEMKASNSTMVCLTEISPLSNPVSPKIWLEWELEHKAARATIRRKSSGRRRNIIQPGQFPIWRETEDN